VIAECLADAEDRMTKAVDALRKDLLVIRTGRANPGLVERLAIDYFGTPTPLIQLASIQVPEARLIVISPYDKSSLAAVERAIQKSDLGLTPNNDGRVIRLVIPPLTEERRRDLVRVARRRVEEARVAVRNVRRDVQKDIDELNSEKMVSADDHQRGGESLQRLTDRFVLEVDRVGLAKEAEILEV
jgi:ribosome recycling factor